MKTIIQKTKSLLILLLFFISFSNSYGQSITTGTVSPYLVCLGNTINVPFVATGNFNQNDFFRVQLSNTTGGFSTSTTIASVEITNPINGTFSGSITATIPTTIPASTQYRVRVVYVVAGASTPSVIGIRNTSNLILTRTRFNPSFSLPTSICSGTALTLPTTSINNVTGTWSPSFNNVVTTNTTTNYTFTPTEGLCANVATRTITVNAIVTPSFNPVSNVCSGNTMNPLPTTSNNNITGSWSPSLNNTATTTYTFTPTAGLCATTATTTVVVDQRTTPSFNQLTDECAGENLPNLPQNSLNGISGTWSPAINNQETTTYTFTPNSNFCANITTLTQIINETTTPLFNQIEPICSGENFELPAVSVNGISGSWSPEINNNETTTYTFTPAAGICINVVTMTVEVNPIITPFFNPLSSICEGSPLVLPSISENGIAGTWTPELNNQQTATYTFTPNDNFCVNTATLTQIVNPIVTPVFNQLEPICSGEIVPNLPESSLNGIVGSWLPAINNQETTTYTFTPNSNFCAISVIDSIVVTPSTLTDTTVYACSSYTWPINGETYTSSGVYSVTSGCFRQTLNLTISQPIALETPGIIDGQAIGLCLNGNTSPTYTISPVEGATSYFWTVPEGAIIVSGQGTASVTLSILSNFTEGNLSVTAVNACVSSQPRQLYIRSVFYTPLTPVGQTTGLCSEGLSLAVFDAAIVPGITNYNWSVPEGTTLISGQGSSSIQLSISESFSFGYLRLITDNVCGSSAERVVILRSNLAQPGLITGTAIGLCTGGVSTTTYSIPTQVGATSYTWTVPEGTSILSGQGTNSIELIVEEGFTAGNLSVVANTACGSSPARTLSISSVLLQPGLISGPTTGLCSQGISTATYSIPTQIGATSYTWIAPTGTSITSGQGTNTIELSILEGFSSGNLSVVANNFCGASSLRTITIRSTLTQLGAISGTTIGLCSSQTPFSTYSVSEQLGASSYTWSIPTGTTILSGQGTNSIVLSFQSNFSVGNINVTSNNQCGSSLVRVLAIRSVPNTVGVISGQANNLCTNVVNNPTYSIASVSGATSYTWTAPVGTTITSGQGTTSITLNITNNFVGGNLSVVANNACGASSPRTLALSSTIASPSAISGTTNNLCPNGVNSPSYTIPSVSGATSYTWTVPSGAVILSGQGTTSIVLEITNSFVSGSLSVVANNACGSSVPRTLALSSSPSTPGTISGSVNNLCPEGINSPTYSIAAVAGATIYIWTAPEGTTIISGQGTRTITLSISSNFTSGALTVAASNQCGTSAIRSLSLSSTPLTPTAINGSTTPCGTATYTCTTVAQAISYTWTVPTGMEIVSGQGTNSITVNVNESSVTGSITVRASNNCRTGNVRSLLINSCNSSTRITNTSDNQIFNKDVLLVYPNPTNDIVNIELSKDLEENLRIQIINSLGQKVSEIEIEKGNTIGNTSLFDIPNGIYLLQATNSDGQLIYSTKVVKQ